MAKEGVVDILALPLTAEANQRIRDFLFFDLAFFHSRGTHIWVFFLPLRGSRLIS